MINSLKFGLFKRCLLSKAAKEGVFVHSVNPYNTSKIARKSSTNRIEIKCARRSFLCNRTKILSI